LVHTNVLLVEAVAESDLSPGGLGRPQRRERGEYKEWLG
jgi:hypothetical protein